MAIMRSSYYNIFVSLLVIFMLKIDLKLYLLFLFFLFLFFDFRCGLREYTAEGLF